MLAVGTLLNLAHGTVPLDNVPIVVILLEPAQVESFVFSTFPKPTSAFVSARKLGAPAAEAGAASTYRAVLLAYGFLVSP